MVETRDEICQLMDKLLLHSLELIEQEVELKTKIEAITNEGRLDLAQTRYHKSQHSVSSVQLPTEDYKPFKALNSLTEDQDELGNTKLQLESHEVDKESDYIDPIRWFGILIPSTLQNARKKFTRSLDYVVECANVQIQLKNTLINYAKLNKMKSEL
ncbi:coiled-coil domain-containing protein 115-like [Malaya genurostris]|uniref:coiled-coil domain-containing protein 115-like n=1 Tax=Malaya genurostris TaxID=325434 RepID=UPI0026F387FC|nr:coiled-coil domain-containing protein 115-like [Malaya genurostris]